MSAVDTTFHRIRAEIAAGHLRPGQRLPTEAELCAQLGVSRGSLREAIRMLVALGVLENRPGSGAIVSRLRAEDIMSSLSLTVDLLPLGSLLGLYELRRLMEGHAAGQAAARHPDSLVEVMEELLVAMEATDDPTEISRLDHEFHSAIAACCGNPALEEFLRVLRSRSRNYQLFNLPVGPDVKRVSDAGHRAIARAVARRDPGAATVAASDHVAQTEEWLRRHFDEVQFTGSGPAAGEGS